MDLYTLIEELDLGKIVDFPTEISGGLLHKMYRVETTKDVYAVKVLNPEIMKRPKALQNMNFSERMAELMNKSIPVISALKIHGELVHKLGDNYYMVFPWINGKSVYCPFINETHCYAIGDILGKIHSQGIDIPKIPIEQDECLEYDWVGLLQRVGAYNLNSEWIEEYIRAVPDLQKWSKMACAACTRLSGQMVISHRDLDPKNVLWEDGTPHLIDWESAGYVNPYQEFLEVVNYWADDGKGGSEYSLFHALYISYSHYINMNEVIWEDVFAGSLSGMLGWLAYNMNRALGIESSCNEEKELGMEQVLQTIKSLHLYESKIVVLRNWIEKEK